MTWLSVVSSAYFVGILSACMWPSTEPLSIYAYDNSSAYGASDSSIQLNWSQLFLTVCVLVSHNYFSPCNNVTVLQIQQRKQKEQEEAAADERLAQQITQQKKQYDEEIKASKAAMKMQKKSLLKELEQGMRLEAKQRFKNQRGLVDEKDRWLHKRVLEGKAPAFV